MIFIRDVKPGNFVGRLDLSIVTQSPHSVYNDLVLYDTLIRQGADALTSGYVMPVTEMNGFCEVPDTYYINTPNDVICVYVKAHSEPANFIWDNKITQTIDVPSDSIVFLPVQGTQLTYDDDKLLFVRCIPGKHDPVIIMFLDRYGLPQYMIAEKGKLAVSDNVDATFRSYQGQLTFNTNKQPLNAITIGDNGIKAEMKNFYAGFIDSPAYGIYFDDTIVECALTDATLAADKFNKLFALDGTLQVDVETMNRLNQEEKDY